MDLILFYFSFISLIVMFAMKYFDISLVQHEVISNIVVKNDENCHKIFLQSKNAISKIKFKNIHKLTIALVNFIKKESIYLKRRFDSKQPTFFLSPQKPSYANRNSVSFFLKKVSEYKDSIQHEHGRNL